MADAERILTDENGGLSTWESFLRAFREKYFPMTVRERKEVEFLEPTHGNLSVAQYEAKFTELAHFAPHMVEDDT